MNAQIDAFRTRLNDIRSELLARYGQDFVVTDRLKILIAATAGVLLLSALIGLNSYADDLNEHYQRSQIELARLQEQIETSSWDDRRTESQILESALEERLWSAQTPGLAEAEFERWLRSKLSQRRLEPRQLQIRRSPLTVQEGAEDALSGLEKMSVKVLMPFNQSGLVGFLEDISSSDKMVTVERLIARSGRNPRIEIDVAAFYRARSGGTR